MDTIGWLLVLGGVLVIRAVSRGRVTALGADLSEGFLALVRGDAAALKTVLARKGEDNQPEELDTKQMGTVVGGALTDLGKLYADDGSYNLGPVKPHVKKAAYAFGKRFGIKTVYGYSKTGSVPGSFHPKGRALDFMTSDKKTGDALAQALIDAHVQWGVIEVIWYRRIWTPAKGWHDYHGPRDHKDHVHASFAETAPGV